MKRIGNLTLTQTPSTFKKDSGENVDYMKYSLTIDGREILVKPVNGEGKVRLNDAFEKAKAE